MQLGLGTAALGRPQYINLRQENTKNLSLDLVCSGCGQLPVWKTPVCSGCTLPAHATQPMNQYRKPKGNIMKRLVSYSTPYGNAISYIYIYIYIYGFVFCLPGRKTIYKTDTTDSFGLSPRSRFWTGVGSFWICR